MESVVLVLEAGLDYRIGDNNTATIWIDDNDAVGYSWTINKPTAAYGQSGGQTIDIPAEITITRFGSARNSAQFNYSLFAGSGAPPAGSYRLSGDVAAGKVVFAANSSTAVVNVHSVAGTTIAGLEFSIPTLPNFGDAKQVHFVPGDKVVALSVMQRIAIEGGQKARLRFTRPWATAQPFTVYFTTEGSASSADHSLTGNSITFAANQVTLDVDVTAYVDGITEGWETLRVKLDGVQPTYSLDTRAGTGTGGEPKSVCRGPWRPEPATGSLCAGQRGSHS